jgi:uncharacterized protein YbjT (DUF2867 family)
MSEKTAAVIGATGMIGSYLTEILINDGSFETVRLLVRRPYPKTHPKLEIKLVDFKDAESIKLALENVNTVFCCIGTTQANVKGDLKLYREIDYDIPLRVARFAKEGGAQNYIVVSSLGANPKSRTFYLKLKGELENALEEMKFDSLHIMRPGLLRGERQERRPAERLWQLLFIGLDKLLVGPLRKYGSIHGQTVAQAMANLATSPPSGVKIYHNKEIALAAQPRPSKNS